MYSIIYNQHLHNSPISPVSAATEANKHIISITEDNAMFISWNCTIVVMWNTAIRSEL